VQALTLVAGFLSLRWLPIEQYARFGLAFAFQSVANQMVDCGFSSTIIALVGDRHGDPALVGSYIRSARYYRNRLFLVALPCAAILFFLLGRQHGWSMGNLILMFVGIAVTIWLQGSMMLQSVLVMKGRLNSLYIAQLTAGLTRIVLLCILHFTSYLDAVSAVWVGVAAFGATTTLFRLQTRSLMVEPLLPNIQHNIECRKLATPQIPPIVFYAFQGQITIALISVFGTTRNIAEVSALGRLGQIFNLFGMFNFIFIETMMANLAAKQVAIRYMTVVAGSSIVAVAMILASYAWPSPLVWVLGPRYSNMQSAVVLIVAAAAISYVSHAIWVMNLSRKFVAWWYTTSQIIAVIGLQAVAIPFLRLSTTRGVLILSVVAAIATLFSHLTGGLFGLAKMRSHKVHDLSETLAIAAT